MKKIVIYSCVSIAVLQCACGPKAELIATRSRRVQEKGVLDSVLVESMYSTKGLHGQQMLYEVGLLDARRAPVQSQMRSYRNREGQVAAGKTVMAEEVTGTPNHVEVKIPLRYMGLKESDLPAYARVRLTTVDGSSSAEDVVELPVTPVDVAGAGASDFADASSSPAGETGEGVSTVDGSAERETSRAAYATGSPASEAADDWNDGGGRARNESPWGDAGENQDREDRSRRDVERPGSTRTRSAPEESETARQEKEPSEIPRGRRGATVDQPRDESELDRRGAPRNGGEADEIAALEAQVREDPNEIWDQMRLRLKYLASGREADALAPVPGTSPEKQELIDEYMAAILPAVRRGEVRPDRLSMDDMDALLTASRQRRGLRIPVAVFCHSIDGFGKYEPIKPAVFSARKFPRLLAYLEVENYTSTRARTGVYRTLLSVQQKLLDADGVEQWSTQDQEIPDVSDERRREFFLAIGPIDFQRTLAPGDYTLVITLRDVLGGTSESCRLEFRVR